MSTRANALAERLELGARELAAFALTLSDAEWRSRIPGDGRKIGVVVHHVAYMYPIEIQVAQTVAEGQPVVGLTWDDVHAINAAHARENDAVTREEALDAAPAQQRGRGGRDPGAGRRGARPGRAGVAQRGRAAHLPVRAGGPRGPPQLPPPRQDQERGGGAALGRVNGALLGRHLASRGREPLGGVPHDDSQQSRLT